MQDDVGAPLWAGRELYCPDQRLCIGTPARHEAASPIKNAAARTPAVTPQRILKSFNTRAFKREKPDKPELMLEFIARAHACRAPIPFVAHWGKGPRSMLAAPEFACLDFLKAMISRIVEIYDRGAHLTLVFTDTHAALNGHLQADISSYFQDLEFVARRYRFDTCLLSTLVNDSDLSPAPEEQLPSDDMLAQLRASAVKWFKGEGSADEGAIRYFQANLVERKVIERAFSRSIFITFSSSKLKGLFPDTLPIFYMFSLRHGVSDKPWFLPPDYTGRKPQNEKSIELRQPRSELRDGPVR